MTSAFIDDGYTEEGRFDAVPGLHPAVEFSFRPLLLEEVRAWGKDCRKTPDKANQLAAECMARQVLEWDLGEHITKENILKLKPHVFNRLWSVICGSEPHDGTAEPLDPENEGKNSPAG